MYVCMYVGGCNNLLWWQLFEVPGPAPNPLGPVEGKGMNNIHTCTQTYIHTHTYIHTYIYTYIQYDKQSRFVQEEEKWIKKAKNDPSQAQQVCVWRCMYVCMYGRICRCMYVYDIQFWLGDSGQTSMYVLSSCMYVCMYVYVLYIQYLHTMHTILYIHTYILPGQYICYLIAANLSNYSTLIEPVPYWTST